MVRILIDDDEKWLLPKASGFHWLTIAIIRKAIIKWIRLQQIIFDEKICIALSQEIVQCNSLRA